MPLVLEAKNTFRYVLESDRNKPDEKQPYFELLFLKGRKHKAIAALADSFGEGKLNQTIDNVFEILRQGVAGWGNMITVDDEELIFDRDNLEDYLTVEEAMELSKAILDQNVVVDDKKKSESPSD